MDKRQGCFECGINGHQAKNCQNRKFVANRDWKCGCNINQLQQLNFNGLIKTHCCECGKIERSLNMEWHQTQIGKMRCLECKNQTGQQQRRFPKPPQQEERPKFGECINCRQ